MCQCTTTWYGILDLTAGFLSAHGSYGGSVSEVENNMGCDCEACGKELFISPIHFFSHDPLAASAVMHATQGFRGAKKMSTMELEESKMPKVIHTVCQKIQ